MIQAEPLQISGQLPSPKGVALAVLQLSRQRNATLGEIARVIQTDPALSGRLIKLANNVSRISRPVVSVQEAVARNGMGTVIQLALGFSLLDQYRAGACAAFDYQRYWSHSLLMGLTMQALSERVRVGANDELFICGLLAQVGKLALATAYPEEFNAVLSTCRDAPANELVTQERVHLATDHSELGTVLLSDWGIPKVFLNPIACYENTCTTEFPRDSRSNSILVMLRLSHLLADYGLAEANERSQLLKQWMALAVEIDIPEEAAGAFIDDAIARWCDWGKMLNIPTASPPPIVQPEPAPAPATPAHAPLRIVVAVADPEARRALVARLSEENGHVVYTAEHGNAALALAMDVLPHVVFAHFDLPRLNGSELCAALRATDEGQRMHIVLVADHLDEDHITRAYDAGADDAAPCGIGAAGLRARLYAAQRLVNLQNDWARDRAQLRQTAAELAVVNRRLASAALTDQLTGLPNRRSAMDQLEQAWSAAGRAEKPLSVMIIDVDHFKQINDTFGHATGDEVLRDTAATLRASARREDSVCRIGGEEFLVICPNTTLKAALQSAERLRAALESKHIHIGDSKKTITISIGVAARESGIDSIDALVSTADQGLYEAKHGGRNQARTKQTSTQ